ncbi:hypothetical protein D3C78_1649390 [compost metagenome]
MVLLFASILSTSDSTKEDICPFTNSRTPAALESLVYQVNARLVPASPLKVVTRSYGADDFAELPDLDHSIPIATKIRTITTIPRMIANL